MSKKSKKIIKALKKDLSHLTISKIATIFTILTVLFSYILGSISNFVEKGYTEELGISNITISLSFSSIIIYLFLPIVFSIITLAIIITQKDDVIPKNIPIYIFKFLCFFQIAFFGVIMYLQYIITSNLSSIEIMPGLIMCLLDSILLLTLYFKRKKESHITFLKNREKYANFNTLILTAFNFFILDYIFKDVYFAFLLSIFALFCALISIVPLYFYDSIEFIKAMKIDKKKMKKHFYNPDSPLKCFLLFLSVSILLFLLNPIAFKKYGKEIIYSEAIYSTIESSSNSNKDGYLLFKTTDGLYITVSYKIDTKESDENHKYIYILPGYKYVNIHNIQILEQKFTIVKSQS